MAICARDSFRISHHLVLDENTPYYAELQRSWHEGLRDVFGALPSFDWETGADTPRARR